MENEIKTAQTNAESAGQVADAEEQAGIAEPGTQTEPEAEQETNDAEFAEGSADEDGSHAQAPETKAEEPKQKPVQSKERNAEEARKRREAEKAQAVSKARIDAIIDATDGINPYTGKEIKDADDVDEYLDMRQIKKNGGDPIDDYPGFLKEKKRAERREQEQREEKSAKVRSDLQDFHEKHPDVSVSDLLADPRFSKFADGKYGRKPLSEIYSNYLDFVGETRAEEQQKAAQVLANRRGSPGSVSAPATTEVNFFSREQVGKMSSEERRKNYDIILKSMDKW